VLPNQQVLDETIGSQDGALQNKTLFPILHFISNSFYLVLQVNIQKSYFKLQGKVVTLFWLS
jgi:hypothetical protein